MPSGDALWVGAAAASGSCLGAVLGLGSLVFIGPAVPLPFSVTSDATYFLVLASGALAVVGGGAIAGSLAAVSAAASEPRSAVDLQRWPWVS